MPASSLDDLDFNALTTEAEEDSNKAVIGAVKQLLLFVRRLLKSSTIENEEKIALINALTEEAKVGRQQTIARRPLQLGAGSNNPQNDAVAAFARMGAQAGFDSLEAFVAHVAATYAPIARVSGDDREHRLTSMQAAAHAQQGTAYELDANGAPVLQEKLRERTEGLRKEKEKADRLAWAEEHTTHLHRRHATPAAQQADIDAMLKTAKGEPLPTATSENDAHIASIKDKGKYKKGGWNGSKESIEIHKDDVTNDVWEAIKK